MKNVLPLLCLAAALALAGSEPSAQVVRATGARASATLVASGGSHHRGHHDRRPSYSSARVWVPGAYEIVTERVWVPGCRERVWIEPVFELRTNACGITLRIELSPGYWGLVDGPGHYELRRSQVWRAGYWSVRGQR